MRKLITAALLASTAFAQLALGSSFDFSGYVTTSNDAAVTVGAAVSGTLVLNYSNGWPCCTDFSSPSWVIYNMGDLDTSSMSISIGSYQYSTGEQAREINGEIRGDVGNGLETSNSYFVEDLIDYGDVQGADWITILTPAGSALPYDSGGNPILASDATATGLIADPFGNDINFDVTSLEPVPLPATAWLLLSALGALGLVKKSHRRNPADAGVSG